jgi:hypothetical protein
MATVKIKPIAGTQNRIVVEPAAAEEKHCGRDHYSRYCKRKTSKRQSDLRE